MLIQTVLAADGAFGTTTEESGRAIGTFFSNFFTAIPFWIAAIFVFILALILANVLKKVAISRITKRSKYEVHQEVLILVGRAVYFGVILLGAVIALGIIGVQITAILGFMGIGLGFAFKDILANIIAGVVILTQKKFQIGDIVQIANSFGRVTDIDVRVSEITTFAGTKMIVPNADMINQVIQNYTAGEVRRMSFEVSVHYASELDKVIPYTVAAVNKHEEVVKEPAVQVLSKAFGESAVVLEVRYWIESHSNFPKIESEIIQQIHADYAKVGIVIPFPIRTLSIDPYDDGIQKAFKLK